MIRRVILAACLAAILMSTACAAEPGPGFVSLFDGKTLEGWERRGGQSTYAVEEGPIAGRFTAPTAFRAIKKEDPSGSHIGKYDLSKFRTLFLAGERADPDTIVWAEDNLKVPVIDHWWQTETGWAIAGNPVGLGLLPVIDLPLQQRVGRCQRLGPLAHPPFQLFVQQPQVLDRLAALGHILDDPDLSLIHISEPTRPY